MLIQAPITQTLKMRRVRSSIQVRSPFFGNLMLGLVMIPDRRVKTMLTDGKHLWYNPDFFDGISFEHACFGVAHETFHCAAGHPFRCGSRNIKLYQAAADFVTNPEIIKAGFEPIPGILYEPRFAGMSVERVYNILERENYQPPSMGGECEDTNPQAQQGKPQGNQQQPSPGQPGTGQPQPQQPQAGQQPQPQPGSQPPQQAAGNQPGQQPSQQPGNQPGQAPGGNQPSQQPGQGNQPGQGQGGPGQGNGGAGGGTGQGSGQSNSTAPGGGQGPDQGNDPFGGHGDMDLGGLGGVIPPRNDNGTVMDEAAQSQLKYKWEVDVTTSRMVVRRQIGKAPGEGETLTNEIQNPQADWRDELRQFMRMMMSNEYSWLIQDRRLIEPQPGRTKGLYIPSLYNRRVRGMVCAVDTSISMTDRMLQIITNEFNAILDEVGPEFVDLIFCDTQIQKEQRYERDEFPVFLSHPGRGGTRVTPVFNKVAEYDYTPVCMVYFTDLDVDDFPEQEPDYPVLWASTRLTKNPWGERVMLDAV